MNWKATFAVILAVPLVYVGAYFLLMRTTAPAIGPDGRVLFISGFIFARPQRVEGDLSVYGPSVSWANHFFLPIDQWWRKARGLTPSRWDEQSEMERWRANQTQHGAAGGRANASPSVP
jgi:hypothetical protein